jgi:Acetyltransferase (GNAT) domain
MLNMENEYDYVPLENYKDLELYKETFLNNLSDKNIEQLEWLHFKNVPQEQLVYFAKSHEKIAAIYAAMPAYFKIGNKLDCLACQSLDTITDKDHRGKGLFIKLAKTVYEKAKVNNYKFVYGFPNGSSVHGFIKKLDWKLLDPIPFLIKPLRLGYFLQYVPVIKKISKFLNFPLSRGSKPSLSKNLQIKLITNFNEDYNELWNFFSENITISINRNANYMNWRFVSKPKEYYHKFAIYENNVLSGIIVYCNKIKHGGNIGYIMELICKNEFYSKKLLKHAISHMKKEKVDACLTWCFDHSPNKLAYKKSFFMKFPKKLQSIELHFGYACFEKELNELLSKRENWYLSYADSDTV